MLYFSDLSICWELKGSEGFKSCHKMSVAVLQCIDIASSVKSVHRQEVYVVILPNNTRISTDKYVDRTKRWVFMCVDVLWLCEIYLELNITKNSVTWFIIFTDHWLCYSLLTRKYSCMLTTGTTVTGTDHGTTTLCCRPDSDSDIHVLTNHRFTVIINSWINYVHFRTSKLQFSPPFMLLTSNNYITLDY